MSPSHDLLSAAIVSKNFRPSCDFEQVPGRDDHVPDRTFFSTVPVKVAEQLTPFTRRVPWTSQHVWIIFTGASSPYARSLYLVHAVLRSWLPAMPSSRESQLPSQTSLSGQAGVDWAAGAAVVTAADPEDAELVAAAGPFDEVQPVIMTAIQRNTRKIHQIPEIFIHPFLRGRG
jgi:hypothetical protein